MFDILNTIKELPDSARHDLYNYAEYLHKKYHKEKKLDHSNLIGLEIYLS